MFVALEGGAAPVEIFLLKADLFIGVEKRKPNGFIVRFFRMQSRKNLGPAAFCACELMGLNHDFLIEHTALKRSKREVFFF